MASSEATASRERTRILFVPPTLLGSELGETFLDRASLSVRGADSWSEALALADSWSPHLIVLRSALESEVSAEFCQRVRSGPQQPPPRLLMITDHVAGELHDEADLCCDAHLVSPVAAEQLLSTIAELVGVHRRRFERVPLDVLVHTEGFGGENATVDSTLSTGVTLSEDGMLVEASRHLGVGARGKLQFFLPGESERLTFEARVRVAVNEVRLLYVVEFVDLAPQHRALIRRYVESQREAA